MKRSMAPPRSQRGDRSGQCGARGRCSRPRGVGLRDALQAWQRVASTSAVDIVTKKAAQ